MVTEVTYGVAIVFKSLCVQGEIRLLNLHLLYSLNGLPWIKSPLSTNTEFVASCLVH